MIAVDVVMDGIEDFQDFIHFFINLRDRRSFLRNRRRDLIFHTPYWLFYDLKVRMTHHRVPRGSLLASVNVQVHFQGRG